MAGPETRTWPFDDSRWHGASGGLIRTRVLSGPHSPAEWPVNGTVWNMPEFKRAFGCKDVDPMVAGEGQRGAIW